MNDVAALEQQVRDSKVLIAQRVQALKLSKNPEFRKLILDEFCTQEAARYVQASGDPALSPVERADALALAQASGHLRRWLSVQIQMGAHAERTLHDLEQELDEARREEANGVYADQED